MELKKSPKADLSNKRGLMLEIGLVVSLLLVILAFSYTPKEYSIEKMEQTYGPIEEEITEITRQEQQQPEPPKKTEITVITDILDVVTNDTKITTNFDFAEFSEDVEIVQSVAVAEEVIEEDQPFVKVEQMPSFMGGDLRTVKVNTSTRNGRRLVILKDSYGNALPGYLFHSFEEIHVVDFRYFTRNIKSYVEDNRITDVLFANNMMHACLKSTHSAYQGLLSK